MLRHAKDLKEWGFWVKEHEGDNIKKAVWGEKKKMEPTLLRLVYHGKYCYAKNEIKLLYSFIFLSY
jgi:hypothetical protein